MTVMKRGRKKLKKAMVKRKLMKFLQAEGVEESGSSLGMGGGQLPLKAY